MMAASWRNSCRQGDRSVILEFFPVLGLVGVIGLVVFFWQQYGPRSGHAFGQRVAAHLGIAPKVFHALLANGVKGSSRDLLLALARSGASLDEISRELAPSLQRGIERLEERFGPQGNYAPAKQVVARLLSEAAPADDSAPRLQ